MLQSVAQPVEWYDEEMNAESPLRAIHVGSDPLSSDLDEDFDPFDFDGDVELPADRYLDREMSWLPANPRVPGLAEDSSLPVLERCKFLAIFAANLDEFFMVRVAGLKRR